ncbi:MAG TPA: ribonuclease H-like domain-containing protein [bacterium]|nr:ribonuclease H-like domain-containing protein [bacterium]HPL95608.1 ribonuclease H-like domain-containing protein [bacterium]
MPLIFDIETTGFDFDKLSPVMQKNLLKNLVTNEEKEGAMARTGLNPLTGEIVAVAMLNSDSGKGKVYFQAPEINIENYEKGGVEYVVKTEKEILENFWADIKFFPQVISFNGRSFDAPFIVFRSIFYGVKPTKNLIPYRYSGKEHLDLMDQLSFYGAFRNYSLEALCDFFQIKNPKDQGVSGLAINELFKNKEYQKIAEYCMRDVIATSELYEKVKEYLY